MLTKEDKERIEEKATEILNKNNYVEGIVDVAFLIRQEGYEIFIDDLDDNVSGIVDHEKKEIVIKRTDTPQRRRFTLAHELGHIILNKENNNVQYRNDNITNGQLDIYASDNNEVEANYFAGSILMPRDVFIKKFNEIKGDVDEKIEQLSYYFGTSKLATNIRANALNLIKI